MLNKNFSYGLVTMLACLATGSIICATGATTTQTQARTAALTPFCTSLDRKEARMKRNINIGLCIGGVTAIAGAFGCYYIARKHLGESKAQSYVYSTIAGLITGSIATIMAIPTITVFGDLFFDTSLAANSQTKNSPSAKI